MQIADHPRRACIVSVVLNANRSGVRLIFPPLLIEPGRRMRLILPFRAECVVNKSVDDRVRVCDPDCFRPGDPGRLLDRFSWIKPPKPLELVGKGHVCGHLDTPPWNLGDEWLLFVPVIIRTRVPLRSGGGHALRKPTDATTFGRSERFVATMAPHG